MDERQFKVLVRSVIAGQVAASMLQVNLDKKGMELFDRRSELPSEAVDIAIEIESAWLQVSHLDVSGSSLKV